MDAALIEATLVRDEALAILSRLGVPQSAFADEGVMALSPITGELIAHVRITELGGGQLQLLVGPPRLLTLGARCRRRGVVSSCGFSVRNCARPGMISAG